MKLRFWNLNVGEVLSDGTVLIDHANVRACLAEQGRIWPSWVPTETPNGEYAASLMDLVCLEALASHGHQEPVSVLQRARRWLKERL